MRVFLALLALALLAAGCGRGRPPESPARLPRELPLTVLADSARGVTLTPSRTVSAPAPARLVLLAVSQQRAAPAASPPEVPPAEPPAPSGAVDRLPVDLGLHAPIPLAPARLALAGGTRGWVELDVRVDERGDVTEAIFAAGAADTSLMRRAVDAAMAMRYRPARRAGQPVAVWCRQRFEVGR